MTDLWLPKVKELILPPAGLTVGTRGRYKIEAICKFTGKRRVLADWFENLITTNGGNLLSGNNFLQTCCVGSGNAAPALTDTALQTLVGSTTTTTANTNSNTGSAPWAGITSTTYRFAAGVATGNLAEVGVGVTSTNLLSRALILDGGGSPTTITVLGSEALDVTYQLYNYAPTADVTGVVTIAGVNYNYTLRAALANATVAWSILDSETSALRAPTVYNGAIGAVTSSPTGTAATGAIASTNAYSAGSFQRVGTATFDLTAGNVAGGISAALVAWGSVSGRRGQFQIGFSPAIPKDGTKVLTLTFQLNWAINSP